MLSRLAATAALAVLAALPFPAGAAAPSGPIVVEAAWARATPPGAKVGGGYLTIRNTGTEDDRLIAVIASVSERAEMHEMAMEGDVMKMRPVEGGIAVPAGGTVQLAPGGYHLMFVGLAHPLKPGETVDATLTFEKAGETAVTFRVEPIGAPGPSAMPMHHGAGTHEGH